MIVAAAWMLGALLSVTIRCVCYTQGEGFYPTTYSSSMAWKWYKPTVAVCMTFTVVKLIALMAFAVYASLAYIEGKQLSSTLSQEYAHLAATVEVQYDHSAALQSLIDGDLRVAGRMYSSAFVGDVPSLLQPAQACQLRIIHDNLCGSLANILFIQEGNWTIVFGCSNMHDLDLQL